MVQGMTRKHQQLLYHPDNFSIFMYNLTFSNVVILQAVPPVQGSLLRE